MTAKALQRRPPPGSRSSSGVGLDAAMLVVASYFRLDESMARGSRTVEMCPKQSLRFASKLGRQRGMRSVPPRGSGWVQPVAFENLANSHADHQPTRYRVVVLTSCRVDDRLLRQSRDNSNSVTQHCSHTTYATQQRGVLNERDSSAGLSRQRDQQISRHQTRLAIRNRRRIRHVLVHVRVVEFLLISAYLSCRRTQ